MHSLKNQSAFASLSPIGTGSGVVATERTGLSIATVIARKDQLGALTTAVADQFGIALAARPAWRANNGIAFLGTGPDKWLAISERQDAFVKGLETVLDGLASVADQSGALGVLRLKGPALSQALEKGVQVDLSPEVFPAGSVAVTSIVHIGATLWKVDDEPTIDIAIARSLAGSFRHWLEVSAGAAGLRVRRPG